jgi:hypothetical protein
VSENRLHVSYAPGDVDPYSAADEILSRQGSPAVSSTTHIGSLDERPRHMASTQM